MLGGFVVFLNINANAASEGWQLSSSCLMRGRHQELKVSLNPVGKQLQSGIAVSAALVFSMPLPHILGNLLQSPFSSWELSQVNVCFFFPPLACIFIYFMRPKRQILIQTHPEAY